MQRNPDLRADIVVVGLPIQSESLANALIEAIQPRVIIITDAEFPASERASKKLQQRLAQCRIPVFYTRETGAVTLAFKGKKWSLRAMNGTAIASDTIPEKFTQAEPLSPPHDASEE
jgi:beta-lactamase superfamily II metal-dependent hydrolase